MKNIHAAKYKHLKVIIMKFIPIVWRSYVVFCVTICNDKICRKIEANIDLLAVTIF